MIELKGTLTDKPRVELVEDLPAEEYFAHPSMNASTIKRGMRSMLALKYFWERPQIGTPAMLIGRAIHCLCLEPEQFASRYVPYDGVRRGSKWEKFKADAAIDGAECLSRKEYDEVILASTAFVLHEDVKPHIATGKAEVTVFGELDGFQVRCRMDWLSGGVLYDLKSTKDVDENKFGNDSARMGYHISLGIYQHILEQATGYKFPVKILALEKVPPYDCVVFEIDDAILEQGLHQARMVLERLKRAIDEDYFPGIAGGKPLPLFFPNWAMESYGETVWEPGS